MSGEFEATVARSMFVVPMAVMSPPTANCPTSVANNHRPAIDGPVAAFPWAWGLW
jgi:hypothetical protein